MFQLTFTQQQANYEMAILTRPSQTARTSHPFARRHRRHNLSNLFPNVHMYVLHPHHVRSRLRIRNSVYVYLLGARLMAFAWPQISGGSVFDSARRE